MCDEAELFEGGSKKNTGQSRKEGPNCRENNLPAKA